MTAFLLTPDDQDRLNEAKRRAVANPVSLATVTRLAGIATENAYGVVRSERADDEHFPQQIILPLGWRVAMSCEEQPFGPCLHFSMSTPTPKDTLPSKEMIAMMLTVLGFTKPLMAWVEEFREDGVVAGNAVNVVVALTEAKSPYSLQ